MRPLPSDGIDLRTDANIGNSGCESRTAWRRIALYPASLAMVCPCFRHNSSTSFWTPSRRSQFSGETIPRLTGPSATGLAADAAAAADAGGCGGWAATARACSCWNSGSSYTDGYKPVVDENIDGVVATEAAAVEAAAAIVTATANETRQSNKDQRSKAKQSLRISVTNQDEVEDGNPHDGVAMTVPATACIVAVHRR